MKSLLVFASLFGFSVAVVAVVVVVAAAVAAASFTRRDRRGVTTVPFFVTTSPSFGVGLAVILECTERESCVNIRQKIIFRSSDSDHVGQDPVI